MEILQGVALGIGIVILWVVGFVLSSIGSGFLAIWRGKDSEDATIVVAISALAYIALTGIALIILALL